MVALRRIEGKTGVEWGGGRFGLTSQFRYCYRHYEGRDNFVN
jgi:hypothetical protein